MDLQTAGSYIRSRVALIMGSPLITVGGDQRHEGRPARLASIESAMNALVSLASIVESKAANHDEDAAEEYDEDDSKMMRMRRTLPSNNRRCSLV